MDGWPSRSKSSLTTKVRLKVDVPREDMQHAVEHATSDLAGSVKIPGFRPGKVPMQVLRARLGEERLLTEARREPYRRLVLERRSELAHPADRAAPVRVRPPRLRRRRVELHRDRRRAAESPSSRTGRPSRSRTPRPRSRPSSSIRRSRSLRESVADLAPVEGRPAQTGDVVVVDAVEEGARRSVTSCSSLEPAGCSRTSSAR